MFFGLGFKNVYPSIFITECMDPDIMLVGFFRRIELIVDDDADGSRNIILVCACYFLERKVLIECSYHLTFVCRSLA